MIALVLAGVLGAFVAADTGDAGGLAVTLAALSEVCLLTGVVAAWSPAVVAALALLAAAFLLRHGDSLVLAPLFGAGLLLVGELAQQSVELWGVSLIERDLVATRAAHVLGIAALGAAAGAAATIAVRFAPSHAVGVTAIGAVAVVGAVAAVAWLARHAAR